MINIPGRYRWGHIVRPLRRARLVSVKQAEEVGISVHGSREAMERISVMPDDPRVKSLLPSHLFAAQWVAGSTTDGIPDDKLGGMASINFPCLRPDGTLDFGLLCVGCQVKYHRLEYRAEHLLLARERRSVAQEKEDHEARSRSEFIEHARHCTGIRDILRGDT